MVEKKCKKGEVILREGDLGQCMYSILWGRVGVYSRYGTDQEKKLAELGESDFFGEMELLEHKPRSATVVALEQGTRLEIINEDSFREYFSENPTKVYFILQRLCQKLRKTTQDYLQICRIVYRAMEEQRIRQTCDPETLRSIREICSQDQYQG